MVANMEGKYEMAPKSKSAMNKKSKKLKKHREVSL
jgi:hypothetical protein